MILKKKLIISILLFLVSSPCFSLIEHNGNIYPVRESRLPPLYWDTIFESEYSNVEILLNAEWKYFYQMSYNDEGLLKQYKFTSFDEKHSVNDFFIYTFDYSDKQLVNCQFNGKDIYEIKETQSGKIISFTVTEPYTYYESNEENEHQRYDDEYHIDFIVTYDNDEIESIKGIYQEDYIIKVRDIVLKRESQSIDYSFLNGQLHNIRHNYRGHIDNSWYKYDHNFELIEIMKESGSTKRINRYSEGYPIYYEFIGKEESLRLTHYAYKFDEFNRILSQSKRDDITDLEVENTFTYLSGDNYKAKIWDEHRNKYIEMEVKYIE